MSRKITAKTPQKGEPKKSKDKWVVIIGLAIIVVAVAIGLMLILIPDAQKNNKMEELLTKASAADVKEVSLVDLLPPGGNPLVDGPVQVELTGERLQTVQQILSALIEEGFDTCGESNLQGVEGLALHVRGADGVFFQIQFEKDSFSYYENKMYYLFEADDPEAYTALYQQLEAIVLNP